MPEVQEDLVALSAMLITFAFLDIFSFYTTCMLLRMTAKGMRGFSFGLPVALIAALIYVNSKSRLV